LQPDARAGQDDQYVIFGADYTQAVRTEILKKLARDFPSAALARHRAFPQVGNYLERWQDKGVGRRYEVQDIPDTHLILR
jgi:hypothetical protein